MNLNKKDIHKVYYKIKKLAFSAYSKNDYNKCIDYIKIAANVASLFNWFYTDDDLENLLKALSSKIVPVSTSREVLRGRFVFYDFRACDNCCLTQQYLRALISYGVDILYIPETFDKSKAQSILKDLATYPKARILEIPSTLTPVEKIKILYKEIIDFKPEKIFLQISPSSSLAITLFNAFPYIPIYNIDLNDHTFYLGQSCADYFIEYRNRGCTIAIEKRNIAQEKIHLLPYYPIYEKANFSGFSLQTGLNKVVLFSGGNYYKVGGKESPYFEILKNLLSKNPSLIVLYAGMGTDTVFKEFIKENNLFDRVLLLGFRNDISEVFRNCDIYLNTYPFSGGLMCQYAAVNGKPILAYNQENRESDFVETILCDGTDIKITYTNLEDLYIEANKLINSNEYRDIKGKQLQKCIISAEQFGLLLQDIISTNSNTKQFNIIKINYLSIFQRYLDLQNDSSFTFKYLIIKYFKVKSLFIFPKVVIASLPQLSHPKAIIKKIKSDFF